MKRLRLVLVIVLFVTLGIPAGWAVARAFTVSQAHVAAEHVDAGCSAASLKGTYGLNGQGFFPDRSPLAFVGVLTFDGAGKFSSYHDENIGGNVSSGPGAGDYTLGPDCHGVAHWTNRHHNLPDHTHALKFVVVDGGKEAWLLGGPTGPTGAAVDFPEVVFWATLKRM